MLADLEKTLEPKKYVVVFAHADGWGASSANKVIKHLHKHYPDVGIHLIVSKATKDKEGKIATKIDDLKTPRELKETNLLEYFECIDKRYATMIPLEELERMYNHSVTQTITSAEDFAAAVEGGKQAADYSMADLLTFDQLAKRYCTDKQVHYTTRGGPKGGEEAASFIAEFEKQHGQGPEVLLSVDTMAVLPKPLLEKYQCFSTHPGPLDTIKVEGMQGTLRSLVNQVLYNEKGKPHKKTYQFGVGGLTGEGQAYLKGTLFMQHPELDKGPPIATTLSFTCPGMCAYQARGEVYHALTDKMLRLLPTLLDKDKRNALVEQATEAKEKLDKKKHKKIPDLDPEQFATWQGQAIGYENPDKPWGVEVVQNTIIDPCHFQNQMRRFFPGPEQEFKTTFNATYGTTLDKLTKQKDARLEDPWAQLLSGRPGITITQYDPKTHKPIATYSNPPESPTR